MNILKKALFVGGAIIAGAVIPSFFLLNGFEAATDFTKSVTCAIMNKTKLKDDEEQFN